MKKTFLLNLLFIILFSLFNAQTISFVSEKTGQPLPKVVVFGKDGNILATSDIDGKIEKSSITPEQAKFQLVYDNIAVANLSFDEINKDVVKLNDRVKDIEAVVIKNNKPAKYAIIKGNFNAYVTVNGKLNCYVDGVATYVFDNKTKKLKSKDVQQYRIFRLENPSTDRKQTGNLDYNAFLDLPRLMSVGNITEYKNKNAVIKELKGNTKDEIEISGSALKEKEIAFFGYRLYDMSSLINHSYEKDSQKTLRDFLESNEIGYLKLKHKSEPDYNQLISYKNFYPTELDFSDNDDVEGKVKFNKNNSNYSSNYWQDVSFPNMQNIFSSFFKDDLKEKQNKK
ncbi:hypothetical protein [Chryseobacterium geocarposphaerae]|uniref:Plasminogen-binding protein PgbA N-terminal domain-containing protein n=1 Tax=Chryseobacterium geocarposphaerae TaxID=1416776 RepID=A0A2M9C1T6_9FLAO|nr:hypothetical protein [Chryseobacterium geocarposphaerae]PJJ64405.1 hypothetical protein CLV73_2764 [Chryseobacterium geocarposphaerae]